MTAPLCIPPPLAGDDVHAWFVDAACSDEACSQLAGTLSAAEQAAAARFHHRRDRVRWVVAHAALRRLLAAYAGVAAPLLTFAVAERGKPFVSGPNAARRLFFNLSHSGNHAAIGVSTAGEIGIDIEQVRPALRGSELAARYFSRQENAWLQSLSDDAREVAFYRLWVVKEAVLKAHGAGLAIPLHDVDVCFSDAGQVSLRFAGQPEGRWSVAELDAPAGYAAALAVCGAHRSIRTFWSSGTWELGVQR